MNNNFSLFLLFSVLVTGLIINPLAFAQDSSTNGTTISVNATDTIAMDESSNSTSTEMTESNSTSTEMTESNSTSTEMTESNSTSTEEASESEDETAETVEDEILTFGDGIADSSITPEDEEETTASPLKQIKEGIAPESIICKEGLERVFKLNGQPACVKTTSIQKLIAWGWTQ